MTRRTARFLTRLYPPAWRARYGEEFQTFLESRRVRPLEVLDAIASALSERLAGSLTIMLYACLATFAAGGALYLTTSGAPLVQIIDTHRALWLGWALIEAGSLALAAAGVVAVTPVLFRTLRKPSREVLWKLVWPVGAGLMLALWLLVVWLTGAAEKGLPVAWVTLLGLGTFVEKSAGFLRYVIAHSGLPQSLGRAKLATLAMAASIVVTTIMAAGWGLAANIYTVFGWGPFVYWSVVLTVLCEAVISGVLSARRLFAGRME
jgi:hypothetical protein